MTATMTTALSQMTPEAFAALGRTQIVYIKPAVRNETTVFEIHAADGTTLAAEGSIEAAIASALSHDLRPVSVH